MAYSAVAKRQGGGDFGNVRAKLGTANGLELIWRSSEIFADILSNFRECHDLCVSSKLFDDSAILKIDQCAVDFRQLSLDSVSIAKRVSNQWLDTAIVVFENIKDIENPKDMLDLLSKQARELSYCFKVIAAWASDLGGRFHRAQDGTIREAEEIKKVFGTASKNEEDNLELLKEEERKAMNYFDECNEAVSSLRSKLRDAWFFDLRKFAWSRQLSFVENELSEARKAKDTAVANRQKAEGELQEKTKKNGKAKSVVDTSAKLKDMLANVQSTCETVATFWANEAQRLISEDPKRERSKGAQNTMEERVAYWTKAKREIDHYAMAMSKINNSYNFVTKAKPTEAQVVQYENLDITLRVPKCFKV